MAKNGNTISARARRHRRIRSRVFGTAARPRLAVFRSNKYVFAQLIDDDAGRTLAAARVAKNAAAKAGEEIAKSATAQKITAAVFDRGGYLYAGRVKAVAEGARRGGLKF